MNGRILVADDDQAMCELLNDSLMQRGYVVTWRTSADEALSVLSVADYDVALADLNMPGKDGLEMCRQIALNRPDVPTIVMTAFGSMDTAIGAIRAGAYDFITKPVDLDILTLVIERAIRHRSLLDQIRRLKADSGMRPSPERILGNSAAIRQMFDRIARVETTNSSVMITGESGSGKELVACALHENGDRRSGPFVPVNCSAIPETLFESELFGHTKGAYTDAKGERKGLLMQANGGTIFLDEVGDIPLNLQPKLLRCIEERRIRPVGSDKDLAFDARFIAATNRDLESALEAGQFRDDLYYRLNVIEIRVPPLRTRGADVLLLAAHFVGEYSSLQQKSIVGLTEKVSQLLMEYPWPGNIRELRNAIEHAVALARYEKIVPEDLPERIREFRGDHVLVSSNNPSELVTMEEVEKRYILKVLDAVSGNRSTAARILGIDRKTLYRKIRYLLPEPDKSQ